MQLIAKLQYAPYFLTVNSIVRFAALLGVLAGSLWGADLTGKWTFHTKFFLHSGDPWFEFKQQGEVLTGTYHGYFGEAPLTGTVKGDQVEFSMQDNRGKASYRGTVTGDSMKGTAHYPLPLGTGHFTGKRTP